MYGWYYHGWSWFPGVAMGVGMLLVLVLLIVGAVLFARRYPPAGRVGPSSDAMHILQDRYARGEIDEQEYQRRREQLLR